MFTKKQLYKLIIPLIIEQLLAVTVGMADVMMVSRAGEAAMSGVSLVDTLNNLLITMFAALSTGGAVVASQYLGHKESEKSRKSGEQLLLATTVIASIVAVVALIGNEGILRFIYKDIDSEIMYNAKVYFYITALSFPFLAIYSSCAALFRAMGNSKVSMAISLIMNIINVVGNAILILAFKMGVEGVAIPTLISRVVAAACMLILIRNKNNVIYIRELHKIRFNKKIVKRILNIGVPSGLESGVFQVGKILVQGMIASFGMVAISANSVANVIASFEVIPGTAVSLAMITVVGQCVGANDYVGARKYTFQLLKIASGCMLVLNIGIIILVNPILSIFNISEATYEVAKQLIIYHSIFCVFIWPLSFSLPNALRAANDVKFTMITSILTMCFCRIILSYIMAIYFNMGVFGIWIAMSCDWLARGIIFLTRFLKGKWAKQVFIAEE